MSTRNVSFDFTLSGVESISVTGFPVPSVVAEISAQLVILIFEARVPEAFKAIFTKTESPEASPPTGNNPLAALNIFVALDPAAVQEASAKVISAGM